MKKQDIIKGVDKDLLFRAFKASQRNSLAIANPALHDKEILKFSNKLEIDPTELTCWQFLSCKYEINDDDVKNLFTYAVILMHDLAIMQSSNQNVLRFLSMLSEIDDGKEGMKDIFGSLLESDGEIDAKDLINIR